MSQDVSLIDNLPPQGSDLISAVVSFNNKSFPGAMGGGILAHRSLPNSPNKLSIKQHIFLYKRTIKTILVRYAGKKDSVHADRFEYSFCNTFPFKISDDYHPSKLQISCAVQGMLLSKRYRATKQSLLRQHGHIETRFASSAAYLMVKAGRPDVPNRKLKAPYAIEGNLEVSLRPHDLIVHNKGFDDHA